MLMSGERKKRTPERTAWENMKARCKHNPNYVARATKVCREWETDFAAFLKDMGNRPTPLHSLDRINNEGDYSPTNCRWATKKEQQNNRSVNHVFTHKGVSKTVSQWADECGIARNTIFERIKAGYTEENEVFSERVLPRTIPKLNFNQTSKSVSQWARKYHLTPSAINHRLRRGWSVKDAVTTPILRGKNFDNCST